jgi:uncharacterized protein DUF559
MTTETLLTSAPFTWPMARQSGMTHPQLRDLVETGAVRRVLRNVYLAADQPDTLETRAACAELVISSWAVICDRTAAWLWGVDTFEHRELEILPPIDSFALRGHTRCRRGEINGGTRDLQPGDIVDVHGLRVTTPLRTALDLACNLPRRDALAALDGFMRQHDLTNKQLERELVRWFRRRGVVQARRLVRLASRLAESPGESWTRMEIVNRGLPCPELQWWVTVDGRPTFRLDMAYPRHKVAVEYDGREHHEGPERRAHDEARREWLRAHGWTVIVVTMDDFSLEAVDRWTREIRTALRLAA